MDPNPSNEWVVASPGETSQETFLSKKIADLRMNGLSDLLAWKCFLQLAPVLHNQVLHPFFPLVKVKVSHTHLLWQFHPHSSYSIPSHVVESVRLTMRSRMWEITCFPIQPLGYIVLPSWSHPQFRISDLERPSTLLMIMIFVNSAH